MLLTELLFIPAGVFDNSLYDTWTYIFLPIVAALVHIARKTVSGYDDLFGILDEDFQKKELDLYTHLELPKTKNQERIRDIFPEDSAAYGKLQNDIRRLVFGRYEAYMILGLLLLTPIIAIIYWWMYSQVGLYQEAFTPWSQIYVVLNLVFGIPILMSLASIFYMVITMIVSISYLEKYTENLRLTNYIEMLKGAEIVDQKLVMGYDTFYENTTPVGSFLYGITWRTLVVVVIYSLVLIIFSFLRWLNLGVGIYLIGLGIIGSTVVLFLWPQLGLHGVLARRKKEILYALITKRDSLNADIVIKSNQIRAAEEKNEDYPFSDKLVGQVDVHVKALGQIQTMIESLKGRTTWGFEFSAFIKLLGGSAMPLIVSIIQDVVTFLESIA